MSSMTIHESEKIECKRTLVDDIKKEIIAFANTRGGTLYIGIEDDGTVAGVEDADQIAFAVSNMVRDAIKPDVTMFVHYETVAMAGRDVVAVTVQRGTARPYYLAKKGLRPEGVYVRQGYSSVPASDAAIRQMIKDTDGDRFEDMRSLAQGLTFAAAQKAFAERSLPLGDSQMRTLGMIGEDGLFTNLALLLSDQCPYTIKAATFTDETQNVFRDRAECSGSLFDQLQAAYDYIDRYNALYASFDKLRRIDRRDYPAVAVREALLNAIVHRDYAISASTLISIYSDRIEITSIGGLAPDMTEADLDMSISICRNPKLANIFYRLAFIEAYGTGIRKIRNAYKESGVVPIIETSPNAFRLTLPNINANVLDGFSGQDGVSETSAAYGAPADDAQIVLDHLMRHGSITRRETEQLLGVSRSTAGRVLEQLQDAQKIIRQGTGKDVHYVKA